jgi:hypothetical protein
MMCRWQTREIAACQLLCGTCRPWGCSPSVPASLLGEDGYVCRVLLRHAARHHGWRHRQHRVRMCGASYCVLSSAPQCVARLCAAARACARLQQGSGGMPVGLAPAAAAPCGAPQRAVRLCAAARACAWRGRQELEPSVPRRTLEGRCRVLARAVRLCGRVHHRLRRADILCVVLVVLQRGREEEEALRPLVEALAERVGEHAERCGGYERVAAQVQEV